MAVMKYLHVFALQHRIIPRLTEQDIIKQDEHETKSQNGQSRNEKP